MRNQSTRKTTNANIRLLFSAALVGILAVHCSSSTVIQSNPSGAKVYLNSAHVGETPYTHSDTKMSWSKTALRLEHPQCKEFNAVLSRDEKFQAGACVGGFIILVPFLWIFGYEPEHKYNLECGK